MARTSKTKIGAEGESNDRMMRAASSGAEAVAQAHSQLLGQYRSGADQANQTAQVVGNQLNQHLDREQQGEQFGAKMAQDESQFARGLEQRQSETELEGAKAGFEPNSREAQLEQEMQKGQGQPKIGPLDPESQERLTEQGSKKLEQDGTSGRWRPTEERTNNLERTQKREDFQADTERIRAMAYRDQVGVAAQKALAAGDKETYDAKAKELAAIPNGMQKRYDRLMKGDVNSNDWGELSQLARGGPDSDPTLMNDLKAQQFTPRVAAFVRAQVQKDALESIVLSKGNTSNLEIDWTAPKMREFQQQVTSLNDFMRSNPALGQLAFIRGTEDKMRFLNTMAASQVLLGLSRAPSPSGGMAPATQGAPPGGGAPGGQQPMGPAHSTPAPGHQQGVDAVRGARASGATPQQALEAGQQAHHTQSEGQPLWQRRGYTSETKMKAGQKYPR
jgi:hypothetical protein